MDITMIIIFTAQKMKFSIKDLFSNKCDQIRSFLWIWSNLLKKFLMENVIFCAVFIVKKLTEECKKQFTCLGENTEKHVTFTVPIENEVTRTDKNGEEITKYYTLQFSDGATFMASSLSNLANNLREGIHKIKCKDVDDDKKCKTCRIKYKYCDCFLEYKNFKDDLIE